MVQPTFWFKTRHRRDPDNLGAQLKTAYDAIVEAGVIEDDHRLLPLPPRIELDKEDPRVELRVQEVDGEGYLAALRSPVF